MVLHYSGPLITLLGVALGAWGTLLMCRPYHPFSTWGIVQHLLWILGRLVVGKMEEARQAVRSAEKFSTINPENRYRTVAGVYLLVFSFVVQTVGAVLILVDMIAH